jgi:peptide chain release factor 2
MILGGHFDLENKIKRLEELEKEIAKEGFWDNLDTANAINQECSSLKKITESVLKVKKELVDNLELINILEESEISSLEEEIKILKEKIEQLEIETLLNGKFDNLNCYLEIHPGAGGTESCDWASMLLRMYERFCEKNNYTYEIIDEQKGDEAGIKSAVLLIKGDFAYGYFKGEKGIHRLVRISPFDSNARRHTSFASVSITPEFNQNIDIEIKESDLKIDVYHSSGAGGQSVNTSNSAVRITHLPTKVVVTCQNERSQLKNKDQAMKMLKSKLFQLEEERKEHELNQIKGIQESNEWGSQIRNYVLEPYKLIKDLRSGYESSNVDKILDGDLLKIMESVLKAKVEFSCDSSKNMEV